jgi:hypothetical protein
MFDHTTVRGKEASTPKGKLLIVCARDESGIHLRLLQQELEKGLQCEVVLGTGTEQVDTWLSEVENATRGVVLLQTRSVLRDPVRLLQLYEATNRQLPFVCINVVGGGYDFAKVKPLFKSLKTELSLASMVMLRTELEGSGQSVGKLSRTLSSKVSNAISVFFNPAAGTAMANATIEDVINKLAHSHAKLSYSHVDEATSEAARKAWTRAGSIGAEVVHPDFAAPSTARSAPMALEDVALAVEGGAPRKRKGSKTNLGGLCQVLPSEEGGQAEPSNAIDPRPRSRKGSKQKMVMKQGAYAEIVELTNPNVMHGNDTQV